MISVIRQLLSGEMDMLSVIIYLGSVCFVVFCASPLHEFAHAKVAVLLGDDTPRLHGRVTINPKAHINWIGALMIFICGFGYAKPVEVRMRNFKNPKRDMALVALAGPVCNLLQAFVYAFLFSALNAFSNGGVMASAFAFFFFYAAVINVNLAVFNFIPVPPLDGSRLVTALLPAKYYFKLMQYERYIMIGLMVLLFTGILTTPLSYISNVVITLILKVTGLPFGGIG